MKNNATSVGAVLVITVLNPHSSQLKPGPLRRRRGSQNPFRHLRFFRGCPVSEAICSTATSRTTASLKSIPGSKFDGISFGDDDDFSTSPAESRKVGLTCQVRRVKLC